MATARCTPMVTARARLRRWCEILLASAGSLVAAPAGAQHIPTGPAVERALHDSALVTQIPGAWVAARPSSDTRLTAAERAATQRALTQIAALWRTSLGTLPGVEGDESQNADWLALPDGSHVIGGSVKILLWPYSVRNGKLAFYENAAELLVWVNRSACRGADAIGGGYGLVLAPRVTGRFHGFPMLDSVVVITHRTAPPCIPVTRGEIIQAVAQRMSAGDARGDSAALVGAADQERALRETEKSNPALAAQLRAEMRHMQRMGDSIRAAARSQLGGALARMSPAERATPAYLSDRSCRADELERCFVDASAPGAHAVVRENPAFFETSRPSDVQIVTFDLRPIEGARRNARYPTAVLDAAFAQLDWAALNALVR